MIALDRHLSAVFHRLKIVSSFALLGAVLAGMMTAIPFPAMAAVDASFNLRAVGAVAGLAAGVVQVARSVFR